MGMSIYNKVTLVFESDAFDFIRGLLDSTESFNSDEDSPKSHHLPGYHPLTEYSKEGATPILSYLFPSLEQKMGISVDLSADELYDGLANKWPNPVDLISFSYGGRVVEIETSYGSFDLKRFGLDQEGLGFLGAVTYMENIQDADDPLYFEVVTPEMLSSDDWNNDYQTKSNAAKITVNSDRKVQSKTDDIVENLLFD